MALPEVFESEDYIDDDELELLTEDEHSKVGEELQAAGITDIGERQDYRRGVRARIISTRRAAGDYYGEHKTEIHVASGALSTAAAAFAVKLAFNAYSRNRKPE